MADIESEIEAAAEFLTRKRGRVKAKWIVIPVALLWGVALAIAVVVGLRHRPELVPFTVSLYGCAGFFVHAYVVAWRSGSVLWRYSALGVAVCFYAVLSFLHADDATAWLLYSPDEVSARPPEPALFVAVVLNAIGALLLLIHGFFLGLGSRTPTATEMGLSTVPDPDAEGDESEEVDDEREADDGDPKDSDNGAASEGPGEGTASAPVEVENMPEPAAANSETSDDSKADASTKSAPDEAQSDVDGDDEERDTGPHRPPSRPPDEA